jgi:hypothetical protein
MGLKVGDRINFTITAPHEESEGTGATAGKTLRSLPVKYKGGEGSFPLNKTNMTYLVRVLGDNSDKWVNATFTAMVLPQNNPSTSGQVLSWTIDADSIKKPS